MATAGQPDWSFRFFDNREKYLLFVSTCNEKQIIAERIAMDIHYLMPQPPALRVFDAGMGDATVLSRLMKRLHRQFPTVPFLIVGKEISQEDLRIGLEKMSDRLSEHPQTVLVMTNMLYSEAPKLYPNTPQKQAKLNWLEVTFEGTSASEFDEQIRDLGPYVRDWWQTVPSLRTGNPVYATPAVIVIYRKDQAWPLAPVIPRQGDQDHRYDLVIAAQPFRAKQSAETKVRQVLAPLSRHLAPGGSMVVMQSTGKDPGMEIIRTLWPDEEPFQTPRNLLLQTLHAQLGEANPDLRFLSYPDSRAEFRYDLQLQSSQVTSTPRQKSVGGLSDASLTNSAESTDKPFAVRSTSSIGTSTLMAAWNAATYVAQVDDERLREVMGHRDYLDVTEAVLHKYNGLWFIDESFIVSRKTEEAA